MSRAIRTDPLLWERIKRSVKKSSKGGLSGTWTARKAQMAVLLYKKKGGTYKGRKSPLNSLTKWTREDWGYIDEKKKTGRYLPRSVRKSLTRKEKYIENRRKGSKKGLYIPYSESVRKKVSRATRSRRKSRKRRSK